MEILISEKTIFYHGSNVRFETLRKGSTITPWKELAKAFSHKPTNLCYDDNGTIEHNGVEKGFLYVVDEKIIIGEDICSHPNTTMDLNAEFLTNRDLKVKLICEL